MTSFNAKPPTENSQLSVYASKSDIDSFSQLSGDSSFALIYADASFTNTSYDSGESEINDNQTNDFIANKLSINKRISKPLHKAQGTKYTKFNPIGMRASKQPLPNKSGIPVGAPSYMLANEQIPLINKETNYT